MFVSAAGVLFDKAQVKSFFCRIRSVLFVNVCVFFWDSVVSAILKCSSLDYFFFRGGKDREGEMRYNPFRITPYLLKVQGKGGGGGEEEPCCLALAERIISGYEGTETLRLLKCQTRKDRFKVLAVYTNGNCLCSPSDPLGQAHLHHHALPRLCLLGGG